jgi:spoIIIJ-associated protein
MANKKTKTTTIEVEAVTIEEAIRKALKTLHAKKQQVTIEVLKEEHKGLFGMEGAEPAKIRVTLKDHD